MKFIFCYSFLKKLTRKRKSFNGILMMIISVMKHFRPVAKVDFAFIILQTILREK